MPFVEFLSVGAICGLGFLSYYPNRIAATQPVFLKDIFPHTFIVFEESIIVALFINGIAGRAKIVKLANILFCFAYTALFLYISGKYAQEIYTQNKIARISFGLGFWLSEFFIYLILLDAIKDLDRMAKSLTISIFLSIIAVFLFSGFLDKIDIIREYYERKSQFTRELYIHVWLSLGSVIVSLIASFPVGIIAYKTKKASEKIFAVLDVIQTIPSIAMFGLLMVPLGYLARHSSIAASIGIAGIGYAPALIALVLYAMLPITRNIYTGLKNVPNYIKEASIGMGMNSMQRLFKVEIPLAIIEIVTGIRISLIQTIGNTALAALIGAGGLGVFIFQGLGETSNSLILLGVLPLVALAIFADITMQIIISVLQANYDKTG